MSENAENFVNMIINYTVPLAIPKEKILEEIKRDKCLIELTKLIKLNRFNPHKEESTRNFSMVFNELSVSSEGFILRDQRLVLPSSLYTDAIKLAHEGHQGIRKTKELLRSKVWFPDIDSLTNEYYNQCSCQIENNKTHVAPLPMSPMPSAPWTEVSLDFFGAIRQRYAYGKLL